MTHVTHSDLLTHLTLDPLPSLMYVTPTCANIIATPPEDRTTAACSKPKNVVKFGHAVPEIFVLANTHTYRHTDTLITILGRLHYTWGGVSSKFHYTDTDRTADPTRRSPRTCRRPARSQLTDFVGLVLSSTETGRAGPVEFGHNYT